MLESGHPYREIIGKVLKPGRYIGGEQNQVVKDPATLDCRIALAYPDVYELGMSHMGIKILYALINQKDNQGAERVFAPWPDMERELREADLPLVSLESATPLSEFDILGFSLQYELTYTNVLQMMDLGGIPLRSNDRTADHPLVIAGGPLVFAPEAMAPFIDLFLIGDGEEALPELMDEWAELMGQDLTRLERLKRLARRPGRYIPALYETELEPLTELQVVAPPTDPEIPYPVQRVRLENLDDHPFPSRLPISETRAIFDRHAIELSRGCMEGCRFCQAGMIYRPVRERSPRQVVETIMQGLRESGYDEVSLTSLSTADYSAIVPLVKELMDRLDGEQVSLAVSSLRAYGLPEALLDEISRVRATSLTFAPEAGTQRLRDVINKNITKEQILESARRVYSRKWDHIKLYFMIGLPTETEEDVEEIMQTCLHCRDVGNALPDRKNGQGRPVQVTCSISGFVPKPHTPFQWAAMNTPEQLAEKQGVLQRLGRKRRIGIKWHEAEISYLEGIICRGDRRVGDLIETAYRRGARFDSWNEHFRIDLWREVIAELGLIDGHYLGAIPLDARLTWDHIDPGLERKFLEREYRRSLEGQLSPPCGKPRDLVAHPVDLAGAEAQTAPLVCYHCGIACDLSEIRERQIQGHRELETLKTERPPHEDHPPRRYRFVYTRRGESTAMGHLDLLRHWPRALRRAGLRVAYSQGYHPHPRISFSPALPTGQEGFGEQVEIMLESVRPPEEVASLLEGMLPEGIGIITAHADEAIPLSKRLRSVRILINFTLPDDADPAALCGELLGRGEIIRTRDRKGKRRSIDFRPTLLDLHPAGGEESTAATRGGLTAGNCTVTATLALGRAALKAEEICELLGGEPDTCRALRLGFDLEAIPRTDLEN